MLLGTKLVMAFIAGATAHRARPVMERTLGHGWLELACYALGILVALPFVLLLDDELKSLPVGTRLLLAYLLAFGAVGAGVGGAWFLESVSGDALQRL